MQGRIGMRPYGVKLYFAGRRPRLPAKRLDPRVRGDGIHGLGTELKDRQVLLNFIVSDPHAVLIPLDHHVLDELLKDMVTESFLDQRAP